MYSICCTTSLVNLLCFKNTKWRRVSVLSLQDARVREKAPVKFAATFPKEKLSVDFGTRCQTLPTNPAFFFPLFQTRWLRILLEKWGKRSKRRREEREGKNSPRPGGRYCMHVHWSTRFVASCLRTFFPQESRLSSESGERTAECYMIMPV